MQVSEAMNKRSMKVCTALLVLTCAAAQTAFAADPMLKLPNFDALTEKAEKAVTITLDPALLGLAGRFLDPGDPDDAAAKKVIEGIAGIYVRRFTFADDFAYPVADVDAVRKQLGAPGWQRLVEVRSIKEQTKVDIYMMVEREQAKGLAIIASEPREFTIVNIVGSIDLDKLHKLEGQFGIPKLELEKVENKAEKAEKVEKKR
jgi:hypothetical protein